MIILSSNRAYHSAAKIFFSPPSDTLLAAVKMEPVSYNWYNILLSMLSRVYTI